MHLKLGAASIFVWILVTRVSSMELQRVKEIIQNEDGRDIHGSMTETSSTSERRHSSADEHDSTDEIDNSMAEASPTAENLPSSAGRLGTAGYNSTDKTNEATSVTSIEASTLASTTGVTSEASAGASVANDNETTKVSTHATEEATDEAEMTSVRIQTSDSMTPAGFPNQTNDASTTVKPDESSSIENGITMDTEATDHHQSNELDSRHESWEIKMTKKPSILPTLSAKGPLTSERTSEPMLEQFLHTNILLEATDDDGDDDVENEEAEEKMGTFYFEIFGIAFIH